MSFCFVFVCLHRCLSALGTLLPQIASHLNDALLSEISNMLRVQALSFVLFTNPILSAPFSFVIALLCEQKLRVIPANVDEFVVLMSAMGEAQEQFDLFMEKRDYVQDLYLLLVEQRIPITEVSSYAYFFLVR